MLIAKHDIQGFLYYRLYFKDACYRVLYKAKCVLYLNKATSPFHSTRILYSCAILYKHSLHQGLFLLLAEFTQTHYVKKEIFTVLQTSLDDEPVLTFCENVHLVTINFPCTITSLLSMVTVSNITATNVITL